MAERPLRPSSGRDDLLAVLLALAIALATVIVGGLAAGGEREAPPAVAATPDRDPACAEWTDGCIVCQRVAGRPECSTPGIACTRGAITCLRR